LIFLYDFIFKYQNIAMNKTELCKHMSEKGQYSIILGKHMSEKGQYSIILGKHMSEKGQYSIILGKQK